MKSVIISMIALIAVMPLDLQGERPGGEPKPPCPKVVPVSVPQFMTSGEALWVRGLLYRAVEGQPDLTEIVREEYVWAQSPSLRPEEISREVDVGTIHLKCGEGVGQKLIDFPLTVLVSQTHSRWFTPRDESTYFVLATAAAESRLMPRVRLLDPNGNLAVPERQVLPYFGDTWQGTVQQMFELDMPLSPGHRVEVRFPVEHPVRLWVFDASSQTFREKVREDEEIRAR